MNWNDPTNANSPFPLYKIILRALIANLIKLTLGEIVCLDSSFYPDLREVSQAKMSGQVTESNVMGQATVQTTSEVTTQLNPLAMSRV